jgi:hypothetical protein
MVLIETIFLKNVLKIQKLKKLKQTPVRCGLMVSTFSIILYIYRL